MISCDRKGSGRLQCWREGLLSPHARKTAFGSSGFDTIISATGLVPGNANFRSEQMSINRRHFNQLLLLGGAGLAWGGSPSWASAAETPVSGGTLNWAYYPDPTSLIAINTSSGTGQALALGIFEGDLNIV